MDKIELLKQYKELLDSGILTQEEFDAKKKQILETPDTVPAPAPAGSGKLDGILSGAKEKSEQAKKAAKEKSEQAKAAANEKLEELKKKQAEEAEKKKQEEEERKAKQAEFEKEKAEKARLEKEQKAKEAEEKRIQKAKEAEEKRIRKEEKKKQNKEKRQAFFKKKSVKAAIGIISALIIAFAGFGIYSYVTRETITDDFNETKDYKLHELAYKVPANWVEDSSIITPGNYTKESKCYARKDKNGNVLAGVGYMYDGDDTTILDVVTGYTSDGTWEEYDIGLGSDVRAFRKTEGEGKSASHVFLTIAKADYSIFENYLYVLDSAYDEAAVNSILTSVDYAGYKNPRQPESLTITYNGERSDGYFIKPSDFKVTINFNDGTTADTTSFTLSPGSATVSNGESTEIKISCRDLEETVMIEGLQADKLKVKYSGSTEAGTEIKEGSDDITVTVVWEDGTEEQVEDYLMDKSIKLEAGKTGKAKITALGKSAELKVECTSLTKAQYKEKCKTRNYKELLRNASYDKYTKIYGKVLQDCGSGYYRITSGGSSWDDVYMVLTTAKLVEDDWVTCYGKTSGIYSYTTVMGATQKVPMLIAEYAELD